MRTFMQPKLIACAVLAAGVITAVGLASADPEPSEFEEAELHVEQNATDGDTEIVIKAKGGDKGLREFRIHTPQARTVALLSSPAQNVMGIREFVLESPEPAGEAILASYPEGTYRFKGLSVSGEKFDSTADMSHQLPARTTILHPARDAVVPSDALTIQWSAVAGVAEYIVEFENESTDPEQVLQVNVPTGRTSFVVPTSMLTPGADYQVGVATVGQNGNVVFVERTFSTAAP